MNRHERRALKALARSVKQMQRGKRQSGDVVPESPCGHCGLLMDGASDDKGSRAKPGDISVCAGCAGVNRFGDDMGLVPMREGDPLLAALSPEQRETLGAYRRMLSAGKPS